MLGINFFSFKLCVIYCRRYLRAYSCTLENERLDYVRILVSAFSLEVVNRNEQILVEGTVLEVKILEEWSFHLGEDCLIDAVSNSDSAHSEPGHFIFRQSTSSSYMALLVRVDDIVLVGTHLDEFKKIIGFIDQNFCIKDFGILKFFIGIKVTHSPYCISLCQRRYCLNLLMVHSFKTWLVIDA